MNEILLNSGVLFDPLNPDPKKIKIDDIAHALSHIPRWTGHTRHFYSVAQHSLRCVEVGIANNCKCLLELLLHDATEGYLLDMATQIKHRMPEYLKAEKKLYNTIDFVFNLETSFYKDQIKEVDKYCLEEEFYFLMPHKKEVYFTSEMSDLYGKMKDPDLVKKDFINIFNYLTNERLISQNS